jgi:flagellar hook-associated protein 2
MNIGDIIDAINTELDAEYTQTLAGSQQLKEDDNVTPITSQTTWDNIYGTTLQDGDVITFSGTSRSGGAVSGSYTISNVGTDKVQGLLSVIESAFSSEVTASINTLGQIVVTDKDSGASQIALDTTEPSERGLDFGTVLMTNTGGLTGRYAMAITASNDGSDHLVLTHNSYGDSYSFTISEDSDILWTGGDQTANNGLDVAGTLGGETATGSGQFLKGNDDNENTEGLSVKYTGTSTGNAGTIKVTIGTADLFSRILFNITDSYEGYVTFKKTSLQSSIDGFKTKIEQMEAQLERKKEMMINRFVAMEMALDTMKNQSNWLAGQLTSAASAWSWA